MADKSENPADRANMQRLERRLENVVGDLAAELRQAQQLRNQAEADSQRASEERGRARRGSEERTPRAPTARATASEAPVERIQQQARAVEEAAVAEDRLARAQRERARTQAQLITLDSAEAVRRARANEYLQQAGLAEPTPGRPTPSATASAAENVRRAVEKSQAAKAAAQPPAAAQARLSPESLRASAQGMAALAQAEDLELQRILQAAPATERFNGALAEQARNLGLADNAYTKHGYLTSEFISAAGRGEVTFRELGNQVSGTIAKFAGWTAAATSVYAVVGAMHELYTGALQASSGVGLVNRVVTKQLPGGNDELQQQFRDLSGKFNVPIEDTTQAVYGAAKAFGGDLPSAVQAAQQALFGVKVGELSAADSTRYLTAIVNGFGLTAGQLPAIFDTINQAQNRFGGSSADLIAGVAKGAGIFKTAGGDYRTLITLLQTGSKVTGSTAVQVATAISRSASTSLTPQGAARLRGVGLDPTQNIVQIYAQASKKAQGASAAEVNAIARSLVPAGGQYARILAPILENRELYDKVFKALDPNAVKGSAEKELRNALRQPDEQLKRLITDLERLGSSLAQAGGLDLFIGTVKTLDEALKLANSLVEVFDKLPAPLRHALIPLLEIAAVMKGLRRFDVGASLPTATGGPNSAYGRLRESVRRPPDARNAAQISQGLGDESAFLAEERRRASQGAARATYQAERAAQRVDTTRAAFNAVPAGSAESLALGSQLKAQQAVYEQRAFEAERLVQDQVDLASREVVVEKQRAEFERLRLAGMEANLAAQEAGILYTNPTLNRPVTAQAQRLGGASTTPGGVILPSGVAGAGEAVKVEQAAQNATATATRLQALQAASSRYGVAGRTLGTAAGAASTALVTAKTGISAGASGLARIGASTIGLLDGVLLAGFAAYEVHEQIKRRLERDQASLENLASTSGGADAIEQRVQDYRDSQKKLQAYQAPLHPIQALKQLGGEATTAFANAGNALVPGAPLVDPAAQREAQANASENFAKGLAAAQKKGALLFVPQIQDRFKRALNASQTPAELEDALNKGLSELSHGYARSFGDSKAVAASKAAEESFRAQLAVLKAAQGNLSAAEKQVTDIGTLKQFVGRVTTGFGLQGNTAGNLKAAAFGIANAREQIAADPSTAADALQQIQALESDVTTQVNDTLNRLLPLARSPEEAGQYRAQAVQQLRTGLTSALKQQGDALAASVTDTQQAISDTEKQIAGNKAAGLPTSGLQGKLSGLKSRLSSRSNRSKQVQEGLKKENDAVDAFQAEQQRSQFEQEQSVFDATTATKAAQIRDPVKSLQFQLQRSRSRLGDIAKQYGKQSTQYQSALQNEIQLQNQIVSAEISHIQQSGQLRAAQTADPVQQSRITLEATNRALGVLAARNRQQTDEYRQLLVSKAQEQQQLVQAQIGQFQGAQQVNRSAANIGATQGAQLSGAVSDAQSFVSYLQTLGDQVSPDTINGALTSLNQARGALADYVRQQAQALIQAQGELSKSKTTDPVKQAAIDLKTAQQQVQFAQTPAEKITAQAQVNQARRSLIDTRLQGKEDDIEFDLTMEKISVDTAEARYRSLLQAKNLSKAERRQIYERIKALQDQKDGDNSYNLDVSNIRLPTPYEVFRAIKEGNNARAKSNLRGAVQNTNRISIVVNDKSDVQAVADTLDQFLNTSGASALRAMGVG